LENLPVSAKSEESDLTFQLLFFIQCQVNKQMYFIVSGTKKIKKILSVPESEGTHSA